MKQARAWTSVEVTERLAAQPPPPPRVARVPLREARLVDGVGDASRRWREDRTTHRPPPKPKQQTIGGPSIDFQEFVRRQGRDSSRRARKAEARQKEKPRECSFKPRLCENSKRMARNSKFDDRAAPASVEHRVDGVWVVRVDGVVVRLSRVDGVGVVRLRHRCVPRACCEPPGKP